DLRLARVRILERPAGQVVEDAGLHARKPLAVDRDSDEQGSDRLRGRAGVAQGRFGPVVEVLLVDEPAVLLDQHARDLGKSSLLSLRFHLGESRRDGRLRAPRGGERGQERQAGNYSHSGYIRDGSREVSLLRALRSSRR